MQDNERIQYNIFLDYLHSEMAMYDDLSKNEKKKIDRQKALEAWKSLDSIEKEYIKIFNKS